MDYRLTNREFSRVWRRSKRYSANELKWLARRRGLSLRHTGQNIQVVDPATEKVVANFEPIPQPKPEKKEERRV